MAEQAPIQGERVLRIAAISDIHRGNPDSRYPQRDVLRRELKAAHEAGADLLVLGGDLGDRGSIEGIQEVGEDAIESFDGMIIGIGGNHDTPEGLGKLQKMGIAVLEKQRRVLRINGLNIGVYGQNGSLEYELRERIRNWDWGKQATIHHDYTRREYHGPAVKQIVALLEEDIDMLLVLSHVPLFRQQVSDTVPDTLSEMTPETGEFIDGLGVRLKMVVSGHTHSFRNRRYGRDNPITITENGTVVGNIAAPNARRAGRSFVTLLDIYRMTDGSLSVATAPLEVASLSSVNVS